MFQSVTPIRRNISPSRLSMGLNTSVYFTLKIQVQTNNVLVINLLCHFYLPLPFIYTLEYLLTCAYLKFIDSSSVAD